MTTTESETETVAKPLIDDETLDRLMASVDSEGLELLGPDGVLTERTSRIMNRAMEAELTDHLGSEHGDPAGHGSGNNRNGTSAKTVLTDAGAVPVTVRRDRDGEFEPKLAPKHARRLEGFNDIVLSLISRGMTTRDVQAHVADAYEVRFCSWKDRHGVVAALKPICTAPTVDAAAQALDAFEAAWGHSYGTIVELWRRHWTRFVPFLDFDPATASTRSEKDHLHPCVGSCHPHPRARIPEPRR